MGSLLLLLLLLSELLQEEVSLIAARKQVKVKQHMKRKHVKVVIKFTLSLQKEHPELRKLKTRTISTCFNILFYLRSITQALYN